MAQRKNYTPEKKIQIVKNHLVDQKPLSDICDENGLHPTVYYRWQKNLFENGTLAFQPKRGSEKAQLEKKIKALEEKLAKKNEVLSELMEEHVALKKSLGEL